MHFRLTIYLFIPAASLAQSVTSLLSDERYNLNFIEKPIDLREVIQENKEKIDCLVVLNHPSLLPLFNQLYEEGILLPAIVLEPAPADHLSDNISSEPADAATFLYHAAEVRVAGTEIGDIASIIDRAITQFLHLSPNCPLPAPSLVTTQPTPVEYQQSFLLLQQRRLAEKLKERLGYLGVYYKRNPQYFYRNLSPAEKKQMLEQLSLEYRELILNYFSQDFPINQIIDQFVNRCFFADISVSQILEIHMELMDDFAQQLKLEGRSEEILLDYRLALIDILAHLGEMYRRSIPREDIPYNLLFRID
jgi:circadian clock protein KaiA